MKTPSLLKHALVAAATFSLASTLTTRAVTITGFVQTPDSVSFNFAGSGNVEFVAPFLPPQWAPLTQVTLTFPGGLGYSFALLGNKHLPDGSATDLGDPNISSSPLTVPYGTTLSDTKSVAHGTGLDTYNLSITVQNDGSGHWGAFSGSYSAIHSTAAPTGVPDAGSTGVMAGFAFVLLAGAPRVYGTSRL